MAKYIRRGRNSPTNNCIDQWTKPIELHVGAECERDTTGNTCPLEGYSGCVEGYDGYCTVRFVPEGDCPITPEQAGITDDYCIPNSENSGYHRFTVADVFRGTDHYGNCTTPYSRGVLNGAGGGSGGDGTFGSGFTAVINDREEQLLKVTGKPVTLLRRQWNGPRCPCYSTNRGRSRMKCHMCFGTGFVPGFIPYVNQSDPLGRILVRFEPHTEDTPLKDTGIRQDVQINAWTASSPIIRKRDIFIAYASDGSEEYRYIVNNVTRNDLIGGIQGAQKFQLQRLDPNSIYYEYNQYQIPDLADISIDVADIEAEYGTLEGARVHEQLGVQDDGIFPNFVIEGVYGDAAFSGMFTEGYKQGYEVNIKRILDFKDPMYAPDFNEDGTVDSTYGPLFFSTTGQIIKFSTPQETQDNIGVNPLEVIAAEKKRHFLDGWICGAKAGVLDGENELRVRGIK